MRNSQPEYPQYKKLLVERDPTDGRLLWVKMSYPERLNILHLEMMNELYDALVRADKDDSVQAILIAGADKAFCAGADLDEIAKRDVESGIKWLTAYWRVLDLLREMGKPTLAAVKGACVAGGNEMVMMCDLVVAGKSAKMGQPEIIVGSTAAGGGIQLLPLMVGEKRAREMILTGKLLSADEAHQFGLVNRVVPDERVEEEARRMALDVIDRVSPQAFRVMKSGLRYWTDLAMLTWPWAKNLTSMVWTTQEFRERAEEFMKKKPMKPRKFMGMMPG